MDPQLYIEVDTDLQAARLREYFGRAYFLSVNVTAYPMPPTEWPGMNDTPPAEPAIDSYTWYCIDPMPKIGGGGVFKLDDAVVAFSTSAITLSDGNPCSIDIGTAGKTFEQLSVQGKIAVTPPPPLEL